MRLLRHYGTRWRARGDRSPRATPRRPLRSLYIGERAARARALGCHLLVFSFSCWRLIRDALKRLCNSIVCILISEGSFSAYSAQSAP